MPPLGFVKIGADTWFKPRIDMRPGRQAYSGISGEYTTILPGEPLWCEMMRHEGTPCAASDGELTRDLLGDKNTMMYIIIGIIIFIFIMRR